MSLSKGRRKRGCPTCADGFFLVHKKTGEQITCWDCFGGRRNPPKGRFKLLSAMRCANEGNLGPTALGNPKCDCEVCSKRRDHEGDGSYVMHRIQCPTLTGAANICTCDHLVKIQTRKCERDTGVGRCWNAIPCPIHPPVPE